jgi:hypothetical protein
MPFTEKDWRNATAHDGGGDTSTPLSAVALEDLEARVTDYTDDHAPAFSVVDYGAVGDDATDNQAAFSSALSAAGAVEGVVYVPTGTYRLNSDVTVPEGVRLTGAGHGSIIKTDDRVVCLSFVEVDHLQFITITSLARDGNNIPTANAKAHLQWYDEPNRLENAQAHHLTGDGLEIEFYKVDGFSCYANHFSGGYDDAIHCHESTRGRIYNNHVQYAKADGITFYGGQFFLCWGNVSKGHEKSGFFAFGDDSLPSYGGATDMEFYFNEAADSVTEAGFDLNSAGASVGTRTKIIANNIHDNNGEGIFSVGSGQIIAQNIIQNSGDNGIRCGYDTNVAPQASTHKTQIKDNFLLNNNTNGNAAATGLGMGILIDGAINCQVTGNTVTQEAGTDDMADGLIRVAGGWGNAVLGNRAENAVVGGTGTIRVDNDAGSQNFIQQNLVGSTAAITTPSSVTAAATIAVPWGIEFMPISGNTNISSITATYPGHRVTLLFSGTPTVADGSNLKLAGNFVAAGTTNDWDTLTLVCDGGNWNEVARSLN